MITLNDIAFREDGDIFVQDVRSTTIENRDTATKHYATTSTTIEKDAQGNATKIHTKITDDEGTKYIPIYVIKTYEYHL